jgi:hypothetical protein
MEGQWDAKRESNASLRASQAGATDGGALVIARPTMSKLTSRMPSPLS